jgi:antitoxin (DNA-binding transcriptional repressor) of toxin-antitoxin stability system
VDTARLPFFSKYVKYDKVILYKKEIDMKTITATELARNLRQILDRLAIEGEEVEIERNNRRIARLVPGPGRQTALEAMADLYRTLAPEAAEGWAEAGKEMGESVEKGVRDPWGT